MNSLLLISFLKTLHITTAPPPGSRYTSRRMQRYTFHGVDLERDHFYTYARDRDKALSALGHRIYDSVIPRLSSKIQATSSEKDALFFDNLLTNDGKALSSSLDTFMTKEEGIKYALDVASASWNCLRQVHIAS